MQQTQLLCTFATTSDLESVLTQIKEIYSLAFNSIYVLENTNDPTQFVLTYNVAVESGTPLRVVPSTISVHRKKQTNTIYTINALNIYIAERNGGVLDRTFPIQWEDLRNTVLVTAHGSLKSIKTKLHKIVTL